MLSRIFLGSKPHSASCRCWRNPRNSGSQLTNSRYILISPTCQLSSALFISNLLLYFIRSDWALVYERKPLKPTDKKAPLPIPTALNHPEYAFTPGEPYKAYAVPYPWFAYASPALSAPESAPEIEKIDSSADDYDISTLLSQILDSSDRV